jgi:DNA-directed RNA polymerase II subunit RPB2
LFTSGAVTKIRKKLYNIHLLLCLRKYYKNMNLYINMKKMDEMEDISWKVIDTYFNENPDNLVSHHLNSYNDFFSTGINRIFKENNPVRFIERQKNDEPNAKQNQCLLYLGGKDGTKIYFGKPMIYDDNYAHYMYPNDARLRNMWYGITIHYDVDVDIIYYVDDKEIKETHLIQKVYLGRFPIMVQSNLCILKSLTPEVRFNMGECRNDYGGYFIIAGKEKCIVSQEKFANNMIYIRKNSKDDIYSHSAEVRSVSEDASKPTRTTSVKMIAPTSVLENGQFVVAIPNVRKPIPLFIVMRALGVISDKDIIQTCLLNLDENKGYINLFINSIHDCHEIYNQTTSLNYIASFTKRKTLIGVLEILSDYFLPHIGEMNFLEKAYYVGYMIYKMLKVYTGIELPTDRDNFRFKRIELSGSLIYDLFREYYLIQKQKITLTIDAEHYYATGRYQKTDFPNLIKLNHALIFKKRIVESGFLKAFKGNWGETEHTKRVGVVQDLNRLSWNTFISHLRKINLPLDPTSKVVGPRLLNSSQWGFIDPLDTPDGGNIGLHKHLTITAAVSTHVSASLFIDWLKSNTTLKLLMECSPEYMYSCTKFFVNGIWIGVIDNSIEIVENLKLLRRNGVIPVFTSISFNNEQNEIHIYSDAGRLMRPIYYIDKDGPSFQREEVVNLLNTKKLSWTNIVSGYGKKSDASFSIKDNALYDLTDLFDVSAEKSSKTLKKYKSVIDYVDTSEEETSLIATTEEIATTGATGGLQYTHIEIHPSLILGVMGNQIVYPEHNPIARNAFSCGQSKQAVSLYHSNYQMRIDKMGVVLNYGQIPLIKSRYMNYINKEEQPYGVNTIVAIMSYTGYNVEDAILVNQGSVNRGLFRTTYLSMYETHEESISKGNSQINSFFANVQKHSVSGIKPGVDYSFLDDNGMIKENTPLNDKIALIGKLITDPDNKDVYIDDSVTPKKGQLGFVDKAFITEGETGTKIAKIRVREERIPAIGDKMASRVGQKGTIGLIIPEENMPFTADGIRPDLIINPHALPSRMTIGQLIESLFGKACCMHGTFGDCTAFSIKGSNTDLYGKMLTNMGFHSSGNQLLCNGMTGEQLSSDIFIGPTYYMRLKHMVKDKINYRALGPRTSLTRQPVQGRANDGGLRIGEMERDGVLGHGASYFLNESFLIRGDEYFMAVCNKTGNVAIYNPSKNLFFSPAIDGPIKFNTNVDGTQNVENLSRFGRSFSIVRVPYAMKLLMQELMVLNIHMKIITDENVDQLMSMSYSSNYKLLLNPSSENPTKIDGNAAITKYNNIISENVKNTKSKSKIPSPDFNQSPFSDSDNTPIKVEAVPYSSDDFFEAAHDVQRLEEISAEEEQKEKEAKEKELLLSDIIEELPNEVPNEVPNDSYTSPGYPEGVSPAYNPNAENESILEFKEEEKEEEKGVVEKGGDVSGSTKKIVISSSSSSSEPSSSSSSSE